VCPSTWRPDGKGLAAKTMVPNPEESKKYFAELAAEIEKN